MAITHVRFVHTKPVPEKIETAFEELEQDQHILLVDTVSEGTEVGVGEMFKRLDPSLNVANGIVFRGVWPQIAERVTRDPILKGEVAGRPAMALVGGTDKANPGPQLMELPGYDRLPKPPSMDALRQAELLAILQRTQAIFSSSEYHYALPSKDHAKQFIRLADALRSVHDISRITDWLFRFISGDTVVIADTGSLLPLLYCLREQAAQRFGWTIEVATLDQYPHDTVTITDAVDAIRNRPQVASQTDPPPTYLFLISVNSSGRLCRLFDSLKLPNTTVIVVCETAVDIGGCKTTRPVAPCDAYLVHLPIPRWPIETDGKCPTCKELRVIHVHPVSYELLPTLEWKAEPVGKNLAEEKKWFWEIAYARDAVCLHHWMPYSGHAGRKRHFSVHLDTEKLAADEKFRGACVTELNSIPRPDAVLIPEHHYSHVVRDLCLEADRSLPIIPVSSVRLTSEIQRQLKGCKRILVADDAIVTGRTLVNLRGEVFRVTQESGDSPEVNAFVLVSRPADRRPLQAITRRFLGQEVKRIWRGVEVFLPDGDHCPWCEELRILRRYAGGLSSPSAAAVEERIRKLEATPITAPLLMVNPPDDRGDLLTKGSFFGELNHPTAFAAASCAAQTVKLKLGSVGGGIQFAVADIPLAIDAYYEAVILGSILRAFDRIETRYPGGDQHVEQRIKGFNPAQVYPGLLAELALAAIAGKIPGKELRQRLEEARSKDRWLQMLTEIYDNVSPI